MSVVQGILICLIYFLAMSTLSGGVGFFTFYRPLVAGFCVGVILGDPVTGTKIGAAINLLYIGSMSTGGTLPSDTTLAAIIGTTLGITAGLDIDAALAIAIPVGLLGTLLWVGRLTLNTIFVPIADRIAASGRVDKIWIANVLLPQSVLFFISAVPCFVIVYWGAEYIQSVLNFLGQNVLGILVIIGGMLPALGFGLTLKIIFKGNSRVYFFLGFLLIQYFKLDTISLGFIALIIAVIYMQFNNNSKTLTQNDKVKKDSEINNLDIPKKSGLLTKKDLIYSSLLWEIHAQAAYNYERMQGIGFAHCMVPIFKKLYKNDNEAMAQALSRHTSFFNVSTQFAAVIPGLVVAMEEQKYLGVKDINESSIISIKTSLMGPLSGIGDAIIQGALVPILLSFFIGMSMEGNIMGPILYAILITIIMIAINYTSFMFGYKKGSTAIINFLESGIIHKITDGAMIMGCMVIGGLVAKYVNLKVGITFGSGKTTFDLQKQLLDVILPGLLPLLCTLGCYKLIDKGLSTNKVMIILVIIGAIGGMIKVFV